MPIDWSAPENMAKPKTASGDPIASPCVKVCAVDTVSGLCRGCGRTLNEIGGWTGYSQAMRAAIMAQLPARLAGLAARATNDGPAD